MTETVTDVAHDYQPEAGRSFLVEVMERSGQPLTACYQCRRCAAGCTVGDETDYLTPDRLVRMVVMGDRKQALSNPLVWKCVSCYTCGTRCPNSIQTARITETLKQMSKEEKTEPLEPKVAHFHDAFVRSGVRWGRVNEMEFMGDYELQNALGEFRRKNYRAIVDELVNQARFGLAMAKLGRMHAGFSTSKGRKEIKRLYKKAKGKRAAARSAK